MKLIRTLALGWALGLLVVTGSAAPATFYAKITGNEFRQILGAAGFSGEVDKDGDVVTKMEGVSVLVLVGSNQGTILQFRYSAKAAVTLRAINDWNRTRKFGKAYLDKDGDPALDMDVDLEGGVTEARITDAISTFRVLVGSFLKHLKEAK